MPISKQLDNRIRKINKRIADAMQYGFATEYTQKMATAITSAGIEIANEMKKEGVQAQSAIPSKGKEKGTTYTLNMQYVEGRYDRVPQPQIIRSSDLMKIDPATLDRILTRIENVGTIGNDVRQIKKDLKKQGVNPNPVEVKKELLNRYNAHKQLMDRLMEIYVYVQDNPNHFLYQWAMVTYSMASIQGAHVFADEITNGYNMFRHEIESLIPTPPGQVFP